jgi:hypothetical protein
MILEKIGESEAKVYYLETLNLSKAMDYADKIKLNRERIAKINAVEPVVEPVAEKELVVVEPVIVKAVEAEEPVKILERSMTVWGTYEQIVGLSEYMNTQGIEFKKITKEQ